jgi:hypothetical protein
MKSPTALFTPAERPQARRLAELSLVNPFLPRRVKLESEVLGVRVEAEDDSWSLAFDPALKRSQVTEGLLKRLSTLLARRREAGQATAADLETYGQVVRFYLYLKFQRDFHRAATEATEDPGAKPRRMEFWKPFLEEAMRCLRLPGKPLLDEAGIAHLFAVLFQVRRAFVHIYKHIVGRSAVASRLRAAIWESIFTHDLDRYTASRHQRMGDITTLITGPSGSGKELLARAIALSRYVPFDPRAQAFVENFAGSFHPLNLSALSPTLIESELFGHKRGAFTGALADHAGWLERCSPHGTVFLDEIGELDVALQVKLLRILQTRVFQRVGDTVERRFRGKIIAATNRDLDTAISQHRFRADLYYRLCADILVTPTLHTQLADSSGDLALWVEYIARQMGEEEPAPLVAEVLAWVGSNLGPDYAWPGNFRELEQCVRNIWIRKTYRPVTHARPPDAAPSGKEAWIEAAHAGTLTADELLEAYCARLFALTGNYRAAAGKLGLDWRTVRQYVTRGLQRNGADAKVR